MFSNDNSCDDFDFDFDDKDFCNNKRRRRRHRNCCDDDFDDDICDTDDDFDDDDCDNDDDDDSNNRCRRRRRRRNNNNDSCCGGNLQRDCVRFTSPDRLPLRICLCYKGIAFDGVNFYVTLPTLKRIAIFNRRLCLIAMADVNAKYEYITYDPNENVFWATIEDNNTQIAKLDKNLRQISRITISNPGTTCQGICSISFNCTTNRIVVTIGGAVIEINKNGSFACNISANICTERVCSALSIAPYYVCLILKNGKQYIKVFSNNSCCNVCEKKVPRDFTLQSLVLVPSRCDRHITLYALSTKDGECNHIVKMRLCNVCVNSCNRLLPSCVPYCMPANGGTPLMLPNQGGQNMGIDDSDPIIESNNCPYRD